MKPVTQKRNRYTPQSGFSLIEMLVSVSLFLVVITMSVGTLLVLIDMNGRAQNMQLVMTNLSFALDSMTREVRTGFDWYCGDSGGSAPNPPDGDTMNDCAAGNSGDYISIIEGGSSLTSGLNSRRITYYFNASEGRLERLLGDPDDTADTTIWLPLTPPEITIEEMEFVVTGTERHGGSPGGDTEQPTATIYIRGTAGVTTENTASFEVQTTINQRTFDI